jgi:hypothetical protein
MDRTIYSHQNHSVILNFPYFALNILKCKNKKRQTPFKYSQQIRDEVSCNKKSSQNKNSSKRDLTFFSVFKIYR